ncbi:hypothetical protein HZF24_06980 [Sedimentibacter hydroxybenzoicus DSM 7310]|uniref:Uncharacterized protein n=1 Tax=Sedimentibacter hydroxybenzoicus DSM 7310 TaxID=1123245 RepID=A0A974GVX7_SEDHY|nr:hypothetical protein [Sedimentibacter hydroxybenzoicus]NYB73882.1 hypothetical protein [Sedimentibacter hydroxybenzoicus DSM 7310]
MEKITGDAMEVTVKSGSITRDFTGDYHVTLIVPKEEQGNMEPLNQLLSDEKLKVCKIDHKKKKRSLDANAYCFVLCQKISEVIGNTKEFVYKQAVRQVGPFEITPIRNDAVERWIEVWESKGLGWQSEIMRDSKLEGYTTIINYYGSSTYDTKEMSLLLDEIITQAKELGINTMTPKEIEQLKERWGR